MNKQITGKLVSIFILFFALLISAGKSKAQQYPVQCNVQVIPPYSVHLADYYQGGNQKLLVNLTLKDLQRTDLSVRLRISIEGQGIKLTTKDDFIPRNPILLMPGTPELLYGDRLEEYMVPENMNFAGITKSQFLKTGRLPEGVYKFTVEVFEARRMEKVSNTSTTMVWMILNEPPVITTPANNKIVKASDPASVFFTWLPRHMNSQNALTDVEYEFTMVEIWPVNQSPEEAIRSKQPILQTNFRSTSFVYDAQYPMLEPGRSYACRVRAFSNEQKEMFKNDGYSPVVSFVFGQECKPPIAVDVDPFLGGSAQLSIIPQQNHTSFTIQLRDVEGSKWYAQQSVLPDLELKQLKPGATYQYKVQAQCESLESDFTPIKQFTLSKEQQEVECGQSADVPEIDNSPALNELQAGDIINAGGFEVLVKKASGRGSFTGSGVVRIGLLGNVELRTVFENIKVNESFQLTAGEIRVVGSDIYALGGDIRDDSDDFFNDDIWDDIDDAIGDAEDIVNNISDLQDDLGDNNLNDELEDAKEIIERGRDLLALDDPKGADLIKEGADKVAQILDQVNSGDYQITANGIQFLAHENQAYGFDSHKIGLSEEEKKAYLPYYESFQLGDSTSAYYFKPWKSIASNGNDQVKVSIVLGENMTADTVHFENSITGSEVMAQKQGDAWSLNLRGSFHEDVQQLTAYYNVKSDSSKQIRKVPLGALNVISYDEIEKHLVLVPVNMQPNGISTQTLVKYLNETYKVANVKWSIDHALQYLNVDWLQEKNNKLTVSGLSAFSNYTKEMNKLIRELKKVDDYKKDDRYCYLFLIKSSDVDKIKAFMPKKRSWGFVFTDALNNYNEDFCKTVAHELGHGCFRLTHNFDDFANVPMRTTQNLMDYGTGNELRRYQWNDIHNLRKVKAWGQDEEGNAMVASNDTTKFRISIAEIDAEFAPGVGELTVKYQLGDSLPALIDKYNDENFMVQLKVFDKNDSILYETEKEAKESGEFKWSGYYGNDDRDSLIYEKGDFKLGLALVVGKEKEWFSSSQDFKDNLYEKIYQDSINLYRTACDTLFNIVNDPIKLDWLANSDEFATLMAGSSSEWYETFVGNWQKQGFFDNEEIEPLGWLKEHEVKTTTVKFVNATVSNIIKEFGMVIQAADSILKADNSTLYSNVSTKYKGRHSGLYVRYIGGTTSPSNHSIGAAVDLRVCQNPMYTSSNKKHTKFIKSMIGVDLLKSKTAEAVTNAHKAFMEKFHGKNYGGTIGKQKEILDKYIFVANYSTKGKIALSEIEKIKDNEVVIENYQENKTTLIKALENHKSTIVFKETSKSGIDKLIVHLNAVSDSTIPKLDDVDIKAFFTERKKFIDIITNIGFTDLKDFHDYFKTTKPFGNLLFEHGFCDIDLEVYKAFNKAHKMVSKKLIGKELNIEWGGVYGSAVDGMHFSLHKDLITELTNKK